MWAFGSSLVLCNVIPRIDTVCYKCSSEDNADCVKVQSFETDETDSCTDECVVFIDGKKLKLIIYYKKNIFD